MVDAGPALRLVDAAFFAPVGAATQLRRRVQDRLTVARAVGELAVNTCVGQVRARLAADIEPAASVPVVAEPEAEDNDLDSVAVVDPAEQAADADELPIAGYESLAASQVVSMLSSLAPADLVTIERFELAHRHRRTILGKIQQLQRS